MYKISRSGGPMIMMLLHCKTEMYTRIHSKPLLGKNGLVPRLGQCSKALATASVYMYVSCCKYSEYSYR